ncbi:Crp/Fnr family transcriptional regulator [Thermoanaerobacter brockii subsp. lactiethylicus]|uniref:Transcriptional regulator, Crp/Fnr family n=2 Tax=Thermoanaerobacter TaxID=1754 RepID=B0K8Z9_THEP3|nr:MULTISPECIES: Crp/Fnr family transcriptional regulator [Thermoanaerobacter]ABY94612.1 transcriptional regulator, Crp/Fnr family [Thermoanaerobacter pseudethanolicus ATCC 33223]ADV79560.1 cyclic nucleotide-binding protein [Thermoanaerobacter brockii subsp. finnii Ako-1]HBW59614.1 Crp/Fnr family transcriptional regulator [Thermoanaerobacter sp.]
MTISSVYNEMFDINRQKDMRKFFLNIAIQGYKKSFLKNETITINYNKPYIAIITKGLIKQFISNKNGKIKVLYLLQPGEIFGEFSYLGGGFDLIEGQAIKDSEISIIFEDKLSSILETNPDMYKYIAHSMSRKFRIVTMQMSDLIFKDSMGRLCDFLIRLFYQQGKKIKKGYIIDIPLTHENIANLIGCDRVTVTKGLNKLKKEGLIEIDGKKIIIKDLRYLENYVDS